METIHEELRAIGVDLNPPSQNLDLHQLDPDKHYIITTNDVDQEALLDFAEEMGKIFKEGKGGAVILRGWADVTDYEIQDLELIRDNIDHLIQVAKAKNLNIKSRYQILKETDS